jgi:hypothetical protein
MPTYLSIDIVHVSAKLLVAEQHHRRTLDSKTILLQPKTKQQQQQATRKWNDSEIGQHSETVWSCCLSMIKNPLCSIQTLWVSAEMEVTPSTPKSNGGMS